MPTLYSLLYFRLELIVRFHKQILYMVYLRVSTPEYINHNLHDGFVHAQCSHQIGMLVEHPVIHYISGERTDVIHDCEQGLKI